MSGRNGAAPANASTNVDELALTQTRLAHELLGDWYLKPAFRAEWKPLPLELFPDIKLRTIAEAANAGVDPDDLSTWLARNGHRQAWPNPDLAEEFLLSVPARGRSLETQVAEVSDVQRKRKLRDTFTVLRGKVDELTHEQIVERIDSTRPPEALPALAVMSTADLFAPLGPVPWLCEGLALQPGAPWMLSGHSSRGKSWFLTDLALAVCAGMPVGNLATRRGRVRWIHLEGSARDLRNRVQRLSLARNLGPRELDGNFVASSHPDFLFTDPKLEAMLKRDCDGFALAVIDTFAAAAAGMNENDSGIRRPLDMLARVSEATGCAFAVIHHHRKDPMDLKLIVDQDMQTRGSGALTNALSASWAVVRMKKTDPRAYFKSRLKLGKSWYGDRADLVIEALPSPDLPDAVDMFCYDAPEESDALAPGVVERDFSELDNRIFDLLEANRADVTDVSLTALCGLLGDVRRPLVSERVEVLRIQGRVSKHPGPRGATFIRPVRVRPDH